MCVDVSVEGTMLGPRLGNLPFLENCAHLPEGRLPLRPRDRWCVWYLSRMAASPNPCEVHRNAFRELMDFPRIRYLVASDDEFDAVVPSAEVLELEVNTADAFHNPFIGDGRASFGANLPVTSPDSELHDLGDLSSDDDHGYVTLPRPSVAIVKPLTDHCHVTLLLIDLHVTSPLQLRHHV